MKKFFIKQDFYQTEIFTQNESIFQTKRYYTPTRKNQWFPSKTKYFTYLSKNDQFFKQKNFTKDLFYTTPLSSQPISLICLKKKLIFQPRKAYFLLIKNLPVFQTKKRFKFSWKTQYFINKKAILLPSLPSETTFLNKQNLKKSNSFLPKEKVSSTYKRLINFQTKTIYLSTLKKKNFTQRKNLQYLTKNY